MIGLLFPIIPLIFSVSSFEIGSNYYNAGNIVSKSLNSTGKIVVDDGDGFDITGVNLEELLDVWNPTNFFLFWGTRKRYDLEISLECDEAIGKYLTGISVGSNWALKMNDASGRHMSGYFAGNRFWVGAADQCREMENEFRTNRLNESRSSDQDIPPFRVAPSSANIFLRTFKLGLNNTQKITLGLCLPSSCQSTDITNLLNFYNEKIRNNNHRSVVVEQVRNLSEGYSFWEDPTFYTILSFLAFMSALVILGTFYDITLRYQYLRSEESRKSFSCNSNAIMRNTILKHSPEEDNFPAKEITISKLWSVKQHNASVDVWNSGEAPKPLSEALLSFSLLLNISKVASLEVGHDTLAPIHGLRFISMMWIIMVHTCLLANEVADTNMFRAKAEQDFLYQTISNGTYAVDTFFFISGCLVSFLYFRTMTKRRLGEKEITKGITGKGFQFLGMMSYRYFRLTPPYLLVIGIIQVSMKWYHDHSMIQLPSLDHETCEKFWWRNALYINTYFAMEDRCMVWSWYLANDTQFYTIGIIILIIAASYPLIASSIGVFILITSWITTAVITFNINHIPTIEDPFAHYESLYDKPWTRIGPYLIGMAAGWYLYKTDCKLKLNIVTKVIGWTFSITTLLSIVYGLYWQNFGPISSALYTALSHSLWAISIAWILIVCVTGNGGLAEKFLSWEYIYPLSRLTYCAYLIHPALTQALILQGESSLHLTHELVAILFFGIVVASYATSLFFSLIFEAPMVSLLRIVHPIRRWKQK